MLALRPLVVVLVALTALAAAGGQPLRAHAEDPSYDEGDDPAGHGGGGVSDAVVGIYDVIVGSDATTGLDVRSAVASVTARPGGRLRVRVALTAAAWERDGSATVRVAPCTRLDDSGFPVCSGGRTRTLAIRAGAPVAQTSTLDVAAPTDRSQAVRITVDAGEETAVRLTLPGTAWRGPLAGRPFGLSASTGGGGAVVAADSELQVESFTDGYAFARGTIAATNTGAGRQAIDATLRRCAPRIAACRIDHERTMLPPRSTDELEPLTNDGVRRPRGAAPVLTLTATARPSDDVLARATLPWPATVPSRR